MSFFPPQKLIQEIPSVYETLHNLGATLWIPPAHANGVNQFVYPDGSTLTGAVSGTPTFDQSGKIPEILGGSPNATFAASTDDIDWVVPLDDDLQMDGDGTFLVLCTPDGLPITSTPLVKTSVNDDIRNGYSFQLRSGAVIRFVTENAGYSILPSASGAYVADERMLLAYTQSGTTGTLCKNCTQLATGTMSVPPNFAATLRIGGYPGTASQFFGSVEFAAMIYGKALDTTQLEDICTKVGILV